MPAHLRAAPHAAPTLSQPLALLPKVGHAVLGPPGATRQGVWRLLFALPAYLLVAALLTLSVALGNAPPWRAAVVGGYVAVGLLAFYTLLRSGLAARLHEPTLAFPQVLFSIGAVCLGYALMPRGRGLALMWLCLILVYDMRVLSARQAMLAVLSAVVGLLLALAGLWLAEPASMRLKVEAVNIGMGALTLPALLFVSRTARGLAKRSVRQREELRATLQKLQALSVRDALTQAYTRGHMQSLLAQEHARQGRSRRPLCVALLDIDLFKRINDSHGHAVGDEVLRRFGALVEQSLQRQGVLGRWGGEEFLVLLPEASLPEALHTLQRVQDDVKAFDWGAVAPGLAVRFSAGVVEQAPEGSIAGALQAADQALYQAKAEGRDRLVGRSLRG